MAETTTTLGRDEILNAIGNMSVFELAELIDAFKTRFNVTIAAAPVGGAAPAAGGARGTPPYGGAAAGAGAQTGWAVGAGASSGWPSCSSGVRGIGSRHRIGSLSWTMCR